MASKRAEALALAEELLADIEYSRLGAPDVARKASRLARLLDDEEAINWLTLEVAGYTPFELGSMSAREIKAAERSRRFSGLSEAGERRYTVASLSWLQASIDAAAQSLEGAASASPGSGQYSLLVERDKASERTALRNQLTTNRALLDRVLGAMYEYVSERYQEVRFGSAVESAFEAVRAEVDAQLASLVPDALPKLSAAFENVTSTNPEHWANAVATCRRLLKAVADAVRPPGPPVGGRKMGPDHYVNRLADWVSQQSESRTMANLVVSDLEFLCRRLDAVLAGGHKGTHAELDRYEASRFVTGTYLVLGDVLRISARASIDRSPDSDEAAVRLESAESTQVGPINTE